MHRKRAAGIWCRRSRHRCSRDALRLDGERACGRPRVVAPALHGHRGGARIHVVVVACDDVVHALLEGSPAERDRGAGLSRASRVDDLRRCDGRIGNAGWGDAVRKGHRPGEVSGSGDGRLMGTHVGAAISSNREVLPLLKRHAIEAGAEGRGLRRIGIAHGRLVAELRQGYVRGHDGELHGFRASQVERTGYPD